MCCGFRPCQHCDHFIHDCGRVNHRGNTRSYVCIIAQGRTKKTCGGDACYNLHTGKGQLPLSTRVILSHHDYKRTPDSSTLEKLMEDMFASGADVAKIATTAEHIQDAARVLALPGKASREATPRPGRLHDLCHDTTLSIVSLLQAFCQFCRQGMM